MKCLNCKIEMKLLDYRIFKNNAITHKGDGFLISDSQSNIHSQTYVCRNCGLIQQYIPKDELDYLQNL